MENHALSPEMSDSYVKIKCRCNKLLCVTKGNIIESSVTNASGC
jgi:hypothetical protein